MQRIRGLLIALVLIGAVLGTALLPPASVHAQDGDAFIEHRVQPGENLYRIAQQYGVTVFEIAQLNNITNPNVIVVGQVLRIPATDVTPTPSPVPTGTPDGTATVTATATLTPTPTPSPTTPPPEVIHVVSPNDNLFRIASQYGTTVREISALNGITNPNLIHVGQRLRIPSTASNLPGDAGTPPPTATPAPTEDGLPTAEPVETEAVGDDTPVATTEASPVTGTATATPVPTVDMPAGSAPGADVAFSHGVVVELFGQNKEAVLAHAQALGMQWVNQTVEWQSLEPTEGTITWDELDEIVATANANNLNLLLTITNAPAWARGSTEENGPPVDNQDYADFIGAVAARYRGSVDAYEIWSEPNARRNWNGAAYGKPLSAASYAELLRVAYDAVKAADPDALVISAGLLPTGVTNENSIEDRVYLQQLYQAGISQFSDAIGAHPASAANPPDSICCENNPEILGWDDHPSFFFLDTLRDYRRIMNDNGDQAKFLWVTEFGWGSSDGLSLTPPESLGFVAFTSLDEQSDYTIRAFQKGRELGYVGPMFLWNLNMCPVAGLGSVECFWGLLNPAGDPRPVYDVVANTPK